MDKHRGTVGFSDADTHSPKRVLNAGSGSYSARKVHPFFQNEGWEEIRVDIDPQSKPDIVASFTDMRSACPPQSFDAIWASHTLEHLYAHEVPSALAEFRRVLKPDGFALITSPDLEAVASLILTTDSTMSPIRHLPGQSRHTTWCSVIQHPLRAVSSPWHTRPALPVHRWDSAWSMRVFLLPL